MSEENKVKFIKVINGLVEENNKSDFNDGLVLADTVSVRVAMALIHGNLTNEEAAELLDKINEELLPKGQKPFVLKEVLLNSFGG